MFVGRIEGGRVISCPRLQPLALSCCALVLLLSTPATSQGLIFADGFEESGCTLEGWSAAVGLVPNVPPVMETVAITPDPAYTDSLLVCVASATDANNHTPFLSYAWTVDGVPAGFQSTLAPASFARGQTVACTVTPADICSGPGLPASDDIVISNSPPSLASVEVTPDPAAVGDLLTCTPSGWVDADGDAPSFDAYDYAWLRNDALIPGEAASTLVTTSFDALDRIVCRVTPFDGVDAGAPLASQAVTLMAPVLVSVAIEPLTPSVAKGADVQLAAMGTYSDLEVHDITALVDWSTGAAGDTGTGTVDGLGLFTGTAEGTVTVLATDPVTSESGSTVVTVTPAELTALAISPIAPTIASGTTVQFTAAGTYTDGSVLDLTGSVGWSAGAPGDTGTASIGTGGLAMGTGVGEVTITAMHAASGMSDSTTLTVTNATLSSIEVTPPSVTLPFGSPQQQFSAIGTFSDASTQDITGLVEWSSTDEAVATVGDDPEEKGLAMLVWLGSTEIQAFHALSGISSWGSGQNAVLTVTPPEIVTLRVAPDLSGIALGEQIQFTALATLTDGSTADATTEVTWFSSDPVATISNTAGSEGLATADPTSTGSTVISALHGASGIASTDSGGDATLVVAALLADTVTAQYPTFGAGWNDYVVPGSDTACFAADGYDACEHGGERRQLEVSERSSCADLEASDALHAFDWVCDDSSGTAIFRSTGLRDGVLLSQLIDFAAPAFKPNAVLVREAGVPFKATASTAWWGNPVSSANAGGSLATAGTVWVVTSNPLAGIVIDADRTALVVQPGVLLETGATYEIFSNGPDNLWIEGASSPIGGGGFSLHNAFRSVVRGFRSGGRLNTSSLNASLVTDVYASGQVSLDGGFSTLRDIEVVNHVGAGITVSGSGLDVSRVRARTYGIALSTPASSSRFSDIRLQDCVAQCLSLVGHDNRFYDVTVTGAGAAIYAGNGLRNFLQKVRLYDNANGAQFFTDGHTLVDAIISNSNLDSLWLGGASDVTLANVTLVNAPRGLHMSGGAFRNVAIGVTSVNQSGWGVWLNGASANTLVDVLVANTTSSGLTLETCNGNRIHNLAVAHNSLYGIYLRTTSGNVFTGMLRVGDSGVRDCDVNTSIAGLVHETCANQGSSSAVLSTGITMADTFVGKVTADDATNASDVDGSAAYDAIADWSGYDNPFRAWGRDGGVFPADDNVQNCESGESCRIWDWQLALGDTGHAGSAVAHDLLPLPTGNDVIQHTFGGGSVLFLKNATEILDDGIGNDNVLCEDGETCLYHPNLGAYQGHGSLVPAGPFDDGTISGVTLLRYELNGI